MGGFTSNEISSVFTLVAVGISAGPLVMGSLADFVAKKWVMVAILALIALAVPLLYLSPSVGSARAAAMVLGIGVGGSYVLIPLIAAELYGVARLGRVLGVVIAAGSLAEGLAPMGIGPLFETYGSLGPAGVLVGLVVVGALVVVLLPRAGIATRRPPVGAPA
jgi:MFS family permease